MFFFFFCLQLCMSSLEHTCVASTWSQLVNTSIFSPPSLPGCLSCTLGVSAVQTGAKPPAADLYWHHTAAGSAPVYLTHILKTANQKVSNGLPPVRSCVCVCVFVCLLMCVSLHWVRMFVYICSYNVLIISLQVNKEKKIASLTHYKVDAGCAVKALKVGRKSDEFNKSNPSFMLIL